MGRSKSLATSSPVSTTPARSGPGLTFREEMTGWIAEGAETFAKGRRIGRRSGSLLRFDLTITVPDLDLTAVDPATPCRLTGEVYAPTLSDEPLRVVEGTYRLMVPDPTQVETMHMRYELRLEAADGTRYAFEGFKVLRAAPAWRAWSGTSTLYVTVTGPGPGPPSLGIVSIGPRSFWAALRSMTVARGTPWLRSVRARVRFGRTYAGRSVRTQVAALDLVGRLGPEPEAGLRPLRAPAGERRWRNRAGEWCDGGPGPDANLMLTRYQGGVKGPVLLAPGFGMAASSFATPTVDTTLTEYLVESGYDVWLFDHRASTALPSCRTSSTMDEVAQEDWPAAVAEVRRVAGAGSVQVVGHCVGSVTVLMALLSGLDGVRSAVCSQFTVHPHPGRHYRVRNALRVGEGLEWLRLRGLDGDGRPTIPGRALDLLFSAVPPPRGERCGRPVCRWLNATYGLTHAHSQLDELTHEMLDEAFGVANLAGLRHLGLVNRRRRAVSGAGYDVYLPHVERLSMPILFLHGARNPILRPIGTKATVAWINWLHGTGTATYLELPGYSHLDAMIGRAAAADVFPSIVAHLDVTNA